MSQAQTRMVRLVLAGFVIVCLTAPMLLSLRGISVLEKWSWSDWLQLAVMFAAALSVPVAARIDQGSTLIISREGLRLCCILPRRLRWVEPMVNWSTAWTGIKSARVFSRAGVIALVIDGRAFTARLQLWGWLSPEHARAGPIPDEPRVREVEKSAVWQAMLRHGFKPPSVGNTAIDFDLAKHPASKAALLLCATLAGAGLVALYLETEAYIADGYSFLAPHLSIAAAGALLFWFGLSKVRMPVALPGGVPLVIALVGCIASGLFSYGALVVVNRHVAPAVPVVYSVSTTCTTLLPADSGLPRIIWHHGYADYWCQFKPGTEFTIPVRKGLLNTYQFDQGAYVDKIWDYRDKKRESGSPI